MQRFVTMSIEDIERLLESAVERSHEIADATYPPGCRPTRGPLRLRVVRDGAVKVEVAGEGAAAGSDFRLATLFDRGSFLFGDVFDLAEFFRGPVAERFGIAAERVPPRPTTALVDDLRPEPVAPRRRARRKQRPRNAFSPLSAPPASDLLDALSSRIRGQEPALGVVARVVATHLAKRAPRRPECLALIGPTGIGKTAAAMALPAALEEVGAPGAHVFRIDCGELTSVYDVRRFLGATPGLVGYRESPPFVAALREPGCIVVFDEFEKGAEGLHEVLLGLLDEGRVGAPDGGTVEAPGAVIALTSNLGADDLAFRLRDVLDPRLQQTACRDHLLLEGWSPELVGRIGSFAVFRPLGPSALRDVAERAVRDLAREFGFELTEIDPVLVDVVDDLADTEEIGARAFAYAARDLLAEVFAEAVHYGLEGEVVLEAGPPPRVSVTAGAPATTTF